MAETVTRIEEEPAGPLQETRLSLTLKGILAQRAGGRKLALIASGDQPEEVYTIGDQVAGAEIIQIEARRVILRRNGVNEALTLEVETLPEGTPGQAGRYDMGGIRRVDDHSVEVPRLTLQRQLSNLPQLLTQAMAVPHRRGGEDLGFRVVSIEEDSILNQLGIRQQDIIRSVNGHSVRTTPEAIQAYENLKASDTFHVNLLRDGREVTIDYTVR